MTGEQGHPVVMKFGGTSVGDSSAVRRLQGIIEREQRPRLVVVSALSGVTDQLFCLAEAAGRGEDNGLRSLVDELRARHRELASKVIIPAQETEISAKIESTFDELTSLVHAVSVLHELSPRSADAIAAFGEILSSQLIAASLQSVGINAVWVDPTRVLVTDDTHGRAQPYLEATTTCLRDVVLPILAMNNVAVIGGYVGATPDGVTTTLGRGGSDYSAAVFGAGLGADEIQIWTDVDGMLTADPRIVDGARLVPALSFAEASELAYFGAKVLHPETIQPVVGLDIPVRIVNARHPDGTGTTITSAPSGRFRPVTALASKRGVTVIEFTSVRMLMAHGFLKQLFDVFDRFGIAVDVVTTSEVNVSVTIDDARGLADLVTEVSAFAEVATEPDMALLCVIGDHLHDDPLLFARVVGVLDGIVCRMVSQSASRRNITFVLKECDLADAMNKLHKHFFEHSNSAAV